MLLWWPRIDKPTTGSVGIGETRGAQLAVICNHKYRQTRLNPGPLKSALHPLKILSLVLADPQFNFSTSLL